MKQLIRGAIFHNHDAQNYEYFEDGCLLIDADCISYCGDYQLLIKENPNLTDSCVFKEYKHHLITPGFIDVHLHYPQYQIIGSYGKKLLEWLHKYTFVEEQKFADPHYAAIITEKFFNQLIHNGTTTAMSFCTSHSASVEAFFTEASKRNMRMVAGKTMMDRNAPKGLCDETESSYTHSKKLLEKWHHRGRNSYAVTPRFAITSTPKQLQLAGNLFNEFQGDGVLLQTHINENIDEIRLVQQLFPDNKNYFDVYESFANTGPGAVFGHCIHGTEDELKRMSDLGCKVSLCPTSNLFLGSGLFNLPQIKEFGIPCALGSDIGGGNTFSMLQVMNEAYKICQLQEYSLNSIEAWYLATLAGAEVLGLQDKIGNFSKGKEADFIVINYSANSLVKDRLAGQTEIEGILFSLMMLAKSEVIDQVYIAGEAALS